MKGYAGEILDIDLAAVKISSRDLPQSGRGLFPGGRPISTKILLDGLISGMDSLSPGNIPIVMASPLTGAGAPCSGRYNISTKCPVADCIGHHISGGDFVIFFKREALRALRPGETAEPCLSSIKAEGAETKQ